MQICDAPAAIPPTMDAILAEARAERLFPGEGGVDLVALLRVVPRDIPLSVEVPTHALAGTMGAVERARRALAATNATLARLDASADASHPAGGSR
jgi:sugar phosphate isomerase/epimerase